MRRSARRGAPPAAVGGTVEDGIRREREALRELREVADRIVDTSAFTVHELRAALREMLERSDAPSLTVSLVSFGYKYGLPTDADLAFDCRFLPNPFFVEELRPKTGLDQAVADYVLNRDDTQTLLQHLRALLDFALPRYQREGKSYLTIAIGCTGGRHGAVTLVEELRRQLEATASPHPRAPPRRRTVTKTTPGDQRLTQHRLDCSRVRSRRDCASTYATIVSRSPSPGGAKRGTRSSWRREHDLGTAQ